MIEAGILTEEDRVELLEGWIVPKMVHNPQHDATIDRTHEALRLRFSNDWRIRIQCAITTIDSEPEPDLVVVRGPASRYEHRHPHPQDVALLVEVADSSLPKDRDIKARAYARAGIVIYWIVNLPNRTVEVFSDPSGPTAMPHYREHKTYTINDSIDLFVGGVDAQPVKVSEIFT